MSGGGPCRHELAAADTATSSESRMAALLTSRSTWCGPARRSFGGGILSCASRVCQWIPQVSPPT